ncbi:MAG TPA: RtcB family protein, partial [Parafilimonas sp.]|nr:RtcB family protein [Parafilimonas sp.]
MKLKITGKQLRSIGYPEGPVISVAINTMEKHYKHHSLDDALAVLKNVLADPATFATDPMLGNIAKMLLPKEKPESAEISLNQSGIPFNIFGAEYIEQGALHQMYS